MGQLLSTPRAIKAAAAAAAAGHKLWAYLAQRAAGDCGTVRAEDAGANGRALREGSRLLLAYLLSDGTTLRLITE